MTREWASLDIAEVDNPIFIGPAIPFFSLRISRMTGCRVI
jgi:hypothetical protein